MKEVVAITTNIVVVWHKGSQAHLGHELQPYSVAHGSNPFVLSWALGLLRPWARDPCHCT